MIGSTFGDVVAMVDVCRALSSLLAEVDLGVLSRDELREGLRAFGRVRSMLSAAEARWLAEFDGRCAYAADGAVNTAAWLAHHTGASRAIAGGRVLAAKRLKRMPLMADALAAGTVTDVHVRALGRCLTPRTIEAFNRDEALLVEQAQLLEADDFNVVVTKWLWLNDVDGVDPASRKPSALHYSPMLDGRHRLDGELDLEDSIEFGAELDTLYDELWHQDRAADDTDPLKHRTRAERAAAALAEMARRSSAAGDRDDDDDAPGSVTRKNSPRRAQFTIVLNLDLNELAACFEDGTIVPRDVVERLGCDAGFARVVFAGPSEPIDLGRLTHDPSPAQRRALVARDRGCIVPGCKRKPRWCHAHHVLRFPNGPTNLSNLVLLCSRHHQQIHAHHLTLVRNPLTERCEARRPDGTKLFERPPRHRMVA
jgi:hypothetical protein